MKWYPSDWRGDPLVKACTPIARYVWFEMLGLMHEAEPYGHLVLNGRAMDIPILSRVISVDPRTITTALKELESFGVFSRTDDGVIISRRLIRDHEASSKRQVNGFLGGSPILKAKTSPYKKQSLSDGMVNLEDNHEVKPQKPEARSQKPEAKKKEEEPSLALTGAALVPADDWPADAWDQFWRAFPNKVGKPAAMASFAKARKTKVPWDRFWGGLGRYVGKRDDRPWCNPTTWLNQQRWDDQPAARPAGPTGNGSPGKPSFFDIAAGNFSGNPSQNGPQ
jgi:hypothetical protein